MELPLRRGPVFAANTHALSLSHALYFWEHWPKRPFIPLGQKPKIPPLFGKWGHGPLSFWEKPKSYRSEKFDSSLARCKGRTCEHADCGFRGARARRVTKPLKDTSGNDQRRPHSSSAPMLPALVAPLRPGFVVRHYLFWAK